jgi:hypothetical protein
MAQRVSKRNFDEGWDWVMTDLEFLPHG